MARAHLASTCGTSGNDYKSGQSTPASGTPYGALPAPTITAEVSGTSVRWKYSASAGTSGRGPISWSLSGNCSGSGSGNVTNQYTGWTDFGYSASVSCTITVNGTGQSKNASAPANTPAPPVTVNAGCTSGTSAGGTYSPCWFTGSGSGFAPNQRYYIQCWNQTGYFVDTQAGYPQSFAPRTADGAGNINWGIGICYDGILADVGNRYVRVWDDFGHSVFSGHF